MTSGIDGRDIPDAETGRTVHITAMESIYVSADDLLREEPDHRVTSSKCLILQGTLKNRTVDILIDTGANVSAVSQELYDKLKKEGSGIEELPTRKLDIRGANGKRIDTQSRQIWAEVQVQGMMIEFPAVIIKGLIRPVILGMDSLKMYNATVDVGNRQVTLQRDMGQKHCLGVKGPRDEALSICDMAGTIEENPDLVSAAVKNAVDECGIDKSREMEEIVKEYQDVFEKSKTPVLGYKFQLELTDDEPFNCRQYPIPQIYRNEVRKQINTMIEDGIIKKSMTPYVSPIVIVRKKNNNIRFCLDARKLNSKTVARREKPPKIDEMLYKIKEAKIFTGLDFTASYWQIGVHPESQKFIRFAFEGNTVFKEWPSA